MFYVLSLTICAAWVRAGEKDADTLRSRKLRTLRILGVKTPKSNILDGTLLKRFNAFNSADAVKFLPGVNLRDYGGIGGLKTVSVRSLGAEHTALTYDGVPLTNAQTGSIDLGRLGVANLSEITLDIGQSESLEQTALAHSAAGLISLRTGFNQKDSIQTFANGSIKGGSWGLINAQVNWQSHKVINMATSIDGQTASGRYLFPAVNSGKDTLLTRQNAGIKSLRIEENLGWKGHGSLWEAKAYGYLAAQQLPGAYVLYNPNASQTLNTGQLFFQAHRRKSWSPATGMNTWLKYNVEQVRYIDPTFLNTQGKLDNRYLLQETYISNNFFYSGGTFAAAWSSDLSLAWLKANLYAFANPLRLSFLNNLSFKYVKPRIKLSADVLHTLLKEEVLKGSPAKTKSIVSPAFTVCVAPFNSISVNASYKNSFRPPSFNDLYYTAVGNTSLKPEYVEAFSTGLEYQVRTTEGNIVQDVRAATFFSNTSDKIIAIPTKNLFVWSIVNIGKVHTKGLEIGYGLMAYSGKWTNNVRINYTVQRALDLTFPGSPTYKGQVAYTPLESGSILYAASYKHWSAGYTGQFSGYRYDLGQNIAANLLSGWAVHDCNLGYAEVIRHWSARLLVSNFTNRYYDVIKNFPLPGRSFHVELFFHY